MKPGPKPTPTKLLGIRGSWRAKAREKSGEFSPDPVARLPEHPPWLMAGPARKEWKRITRQFHAHGILFELDLTMLAIYCQQVGRYLEAQDEIRKLGLTVDLFDKDGNCTGTAQNPATAIAEKALASLTRIAVEFGLTPSARVGMKAPAKTEAPQGKAKFFA